MAHLYLTESNIKLGLRQGQIVARNTDGELLRALPVTSVSDISVFGQAQLSTQLIRECLLRNISIGYYSEDGHYFGNLSSTTQIDPIRQKRQIYLTDDVPFCLEWSKRIVAAKIQNSLTLLESYPDVYSFEQTEVYGLRHSLDYVKTASSVDEVLGFEGNAARTYFACLSKLVLNEQFRFQGRSTRPPKDAFNSLLSYGYSLLYRNIVGAIERRGFHPYFAFMHKLKYGHAALASDLIEEFRAPLVDRTVLDLINSGQIQEDDFCTNDQGAVYMTRKVSRLFTNKMSGIIAKGEQYFFNAGDRKSYGFQVMLDRKLDVMLKAIEQKDARYYVPYVWRPE